MSLKETFNSTIKAKKIYENQEIEKPEPDYSEGYSFFDWDYAKIKNKTKIKSIPKPGIVIAINKTDHNDEGVIFGHAVVIRDKIEKGLDSHRNEIFKEFMSNPKGGEFEPVESGEFDVFISYSEKDHELVLNCINQRNIY